MPSSIGQPKGPSSCGVISRVVTNAAGHADRELRKIPSRIASPSTNGPRLSTAEPRVAIGRVTSSFLSAHGRSPKHRNTSWVTVPLWRHRKHSTSMTVPFMHGGLSQSSCVEGLAAFSLPAAERWRLSCHLLRPAVVGLRFHSAIL